MACKTRQRGRMLDIETEDAMTTWVTTLGPKPVTKRSIAKIVAGMRPGIENAHKIGYTLADIYEGLTQNFPQFDISFETFRRYLNAQPKTERKRSRKSRTGGAPASAMGAEAVVEAADESRSGVASAAVERAGDRAGEQRQNVAPAPRPADRDGTRAVVGHRVAEHRDAAQLGLPLTARPGVSHDQG